MIKGAFIDYKIRRPQLRDDGPLINTNALFQASIVLRGIYATWANLPICSTDIPDIPTFFISQENILGYEYYHKTHGDNKTTH